jgi:DNA helicase-2/ATP-dependent DNA helicase PcrA
LGRNWNFYPFFFCIYSFRGADYKNVHLFKERVPDSEVLILDNNYRSTQEILDLSNWLLDESSLDYKKKLIATRGEGIKPKLINVASQWEEANFIAENILENFTENNKNFIDHLILSKSTYYTKPLQAVFIQKKIPYVLVIGESERAQDQVTLKQMDTGEQTQLHIEAVIERLA